MGEVRQRGNVWWIRYYRSGKRYEESSGSEKKGAAIDLLKIREGDSARGLPVTPKVGRLRFEEAAADVENDYSANGKRSLPDVKSRIKNHLTPYFGGRRMVSITTADVNAFIVKRQEAHASNAEINRELAVLKRAFRLAMKSGKLLSIPYIPKLDESNVRTGFFERDQFEAVRVALPPSMQAVATFAYHTGWRMPSEILTRQWHHVDRVHRVVRLEPGETKNRKARIFPYGDLPELRNAIEAQWAESKRIEKERGIICPWVFHDDKGENFLDRGGDACKPFRKAWRAACVAAGCPGRIPHDFRRTAIRNFVRAGIPEKVCMDLSGHTTRSIFDRYNVVNEADLQNAVSMLAAATGTEKGQSDTSGRVARFRKAAK
jgi:integrase